MKSYDVKFWAIRPGKAKSKHAYEVRWKVGPVPHSRSLSNRAQADNFLSELRPAGRKGEPFDTDTGLPDSIAAPEGRERSWMAFCRRPRPDRPTHPSPARQRAYDQLYAWWQSAAPGSRGAT
jgi:hypothetical protein